MLAYKEPTANLLTPKEKDDKSNNGKDKDNGKPDEKGNENAINRGNGKKIGLLKKLGLLEDEKKTGQVENILAVIDQIVNGEMNLPPGEHEELFALVREVGKGYTVVGTTWTYNERNQITHKENHIRMEEYDYLHDDAGNMTFNERSQYSWNAKGLLEEVIFPDGSGQKYEYDARGRRTKTIQFNHQENSQWEINYHYKGDSWNIDRETDQDGNIIMEYTYDERNKPLSITYKGETFWYVYNGHGDVVALTDINGQVAARYEYDEWGLPTKMYNRYGERVREGIGWIGDLNTGNGTPGSKNEETDNDEIDQHPGNGNTKEKTNNKDKNPTKTDDAGITVENVEITVEENTTEEITTEEATIDDEVTADITTDLVKENPYRYSGYYFDRKTQFYYLQARYYDTRIGRFISLDPIRGDITNPLSLNRYVYSLNNPVNYVDPTGKVVGAIIIGGYTISATAVATIELLAVGTAGVATGLWWTSRDKEKEKEVVVTQDVVLTDKKKQTYIYRWGPYTNTNFTPREKDIEGLSFSFKPQIGKNSVTTLELINSTKVLFANPDGGNHISVLPVAVDTMTEWIASRPNAEDNPHPYTVLLKSISKPITWK